MKRARILIVEDEFIVAGDLQLRLEELGYEVAGTADNGPEGVRLAASARPDLVLMDIRLKGKLDGIAAAEQIGRRFQVPVVFLTAYAEEDTLQRAKLAEPFGYILKPFEDRELRTVIEVALYKHAAEQEIRRLNRLYAALAQINEVIIRAENRDQLFQDICRTATEVAKFKLAWIGWRDPKTDVVVPIARAGEGRSYLNKIQVYADDRAEGRGPVGQCIRTGEPSICNDFLNDPCSAPWRAAAKANELRAAAGLPLRFRGQVCGVFMVYGGEPEVFRDKEVALLREAAADISFALDHLEEREQLRKLSRAVEQSPVLILITDSAGRIEYVNPKFEQVTGYRAEEVLGKNPRILKSGETSPEEYRQLWQTILSGRQWRGEFHNRRRSGELYWESVSISPIRDASGATTHFVGVKEDLTEKKLLESKFLRAQRLESIGSLASGIAHDLNNIIAPIMMSAQMIQSDDDPASHHEFAQTILISAQRAAGVIKQLLGFARGQQGRKQMVQVRHLLRETGQIARETFPRSIKIEETCAADLWMVEADATQLHQVLLNLSVNARDAMPEGGKLILDASNIVVDSQFVARNPGAIQGRYVRIQVEDTGTGMPESVREHIFESFFTTKLEGQGTGLGLTTVLGIVKSHRGFITFATSVGKGTSFQVYLPAIPEQELAPEEIETQHPLLRGRREWILVVDDELTICSIVQRSLERHNYNVVVAHNGIEALALFFARKTEVHAVVTDYMMPDMDGLTLCRTLRTLSPQTPVVVSSGGLHGEASSEVVRAFEDLGVRNVLHKPYDTGALLEALAAVLHPGESKAPGKGVR
jgi:PAS domain S-box-containing protein